MGNDSIVAEASEVVQDTSALSQMNESLKYFTTTPLSEWVPELVRTYVVPLALKILAAILVFLIGRWVIKLIKNGLATGLLSRHADATLHGFFSNLISVVL